MGIIMINCPATGHGVSTGIEVCATDQLPIVTATTVCPECGRVHVWTKNEAWLVNGGDQYRGEQHRSSRTAERRVAPDQPSRPRTDLSRFRLL